MSMFAIDRARGPSFASSPMKDSSMLRENEFPPLTEGFSVIHDTMNEPSLYEDDDMYAAAAARASNALNDSNIDRSFVDGNGGFHSLAHGAYDFQSNIDTTSDTNFDATSLPTGNNNETLQQEQQQQQDGREEEDCAMFANAIRELKFDALPLLLEFESLVQKKCVSLEQLVRSSRSEGRQHWNRVASIHNARDSFALRTHISERDTWRLLYELERDLRSARNERQAPRNTLEMTEKELVRHLAVADPMLHRLTTVINWLESIVVRGTYSEDAADWTATLRHLQRKQGGGVVSALDPDAPLREMRPLDDDDEADEKRLSAELWMLVRCGRLDLAQELCRTWKQPWRAATLKGGRFVHMTPLTSEGNRTRRDWKEACRALALQTTNVHERATYGLLAGDLACVLPVCASWHDHVWARLKIAADERIDQLMEGRHVVTAMTPSDLLAQARSDFLGTTQQAEDGAVAEADDPFRLVQEFIILEQYDETVDAVFQSVAALPLPGTNPVFAGVREHLIRTGAHMALVFRSKELQITDTNTQSIPSDAACCEAVMAYIDVLVNAGETESVAMYTSMLSPIDDIQVLTYARFLQGVSDRKEREKCLEYAHTYGLDVQRVTKLAVQLTQQESQSIDVTSGDMSLIGARQGVSHEDQAHIRSIEWLCFDVAQRGEAMHQSNVLVRELIASRKLEAVRTLVQEVVPADSVAVLEERWRTHPKLEREANAVREHLCYKDMLSAYAEYEKWNRHHHTRPSEPASPRSNAPSEEIFFNQQVEVYRVKMAKWKDEERARSKTAVEALYNVILFPGGWLVDGVDEDVVTGEDFLDNDGDDVLPTGLSRNERLDQLNCLRRQCLTNLVFLLIKVLTDTQQHHDCLALAGVIADEHHQLYTVFGQTELRRVLSLLRDCALAVLSENHADPLGY